MADDMTINASPQKNNNIIIKTNYERKIFLIF